MTSAINTLKGWGVTPPRMILMQQQELRQVVRKLCSAVAQLSEFGACYVNNPVYSSLFGILSYLNEYAVALRMSVIVDNSCIFTDIEIPTFLAAC
jgi:hypothetical protein